AFFRRLRSRRKGPTVIAAQPGGPQGTATKKAKERWTGQFNDKVAVVTGAGSGLGRAGAIAFAAEGARVVLADINVEGGQETLNTIKQNGGEAIFVKCDVRRAAGVEGFVSKALGIWGRLNFAFNNAGITRHGWLHELTEEAWDSVVETNLKGTWLCI